MQHEVVWNGRGPLCAWPEVEWWIILQDDSFHPIWALAPRTSSMLWSKFITHVRDGASSFVDTKPELIDSDRQLEIAQLWVWLDRARAPLVLRRSRIPWNAKCDDA